MNLCGKIRKSMFGLVSVKYGNGYFYVPATDFEDLVGDKNTMSLRDARKLNRQLMYFAATALAYYSQDSTIDGKKVVEEFPYITEGLLANTVQLLESKGFLKGGDTWEDLESKSLLCREFEFLWSFAAGTPAMTKITNSVREVFDVIDIGGVVTIWDYEMVLELFHAKKYLEEGTPFYTLLSPVIEKLCDYYLVGFSKLLDEINVLPMGKRTLLGYVVKLPLEYGGVSGNLLVNVVNMVNEKIASIYLQREEYKITSSTERLVLLDGSDFTGVTEMLESLRGKGIMIEYIEPISRSILVHNPKVPVMNVSIKELLLEWLRGLASGSIPFGTGFTQHTGYRLTKAEARKIISLSDRLLPSVGFSDIGSVIVYKISGVPNSLLELVVVSNEESKYDY